MAPTAPVNKHHNLGNESYRSGEYKEAIAHYARAIQSAPRSPAIFGNRAGCKFMLGQYDECMKDAEYSIALKPTWAKGYYWKGAVLYKQGKLAEARGALTQSLRLDKFNKACQEMLKEVKDQIAPETKLPKSGKKRAMDDDDMDEDAELSSKKSKKKKASGGLLVPDVESGHVTDGRILTDKEDGFYNVGLHKIDQYMKLQIIEIPGSAKRVDDGRYFVFHSTTYLLQQARKPTCRLTELSKDEAIYSFKRLFRHHTGHDWVHRMGATAIKGKFTVDKGYTG